MNLTYEILMLAAVWCNVPGVEFNTCRLAVIACFDGSTKQIECVKNVKLGK